MTGMFDYALDGGSTIIWPYPANNCANNWNMYSTTTTWPTKNFVIMEIGGKTIKYDPSTGESWRLVNTVDGDLVWKKIENKEAPCTDCCKCHHKHK